MNSDYITNKTLIAGYILKKHSAKVGIIMIKAMKR